MAETYRGFELKEEGVQESGYKPVWTARKNGKIKGWNKHLPLLKANIDAGDCGRAAAKDVQPVGKAKDADTVRAKNGPFSGGPLVWAKPGWYYAKSRGEVHRYDAKGSYVDSFPTVEAMFKGIRGVELSPVGDTKEDIYKMGRSTRLGAFGADKTKKQMKANELVFSGELKGSMKGDWSGAIKQFEAAKQLFEEVGDRERMRQCDKNIVACQKQLAKAKDVEPVKYNAEAAQKEIKKDKRIGGKEAKAIHSLLKGRTGDDKPNMSSLMKSEDAEVNPVGSVRHSVAAAPSNLSVMPKAAKRGAVVAPVGDDKDDSFKRDTDKGAAELIRKDGKTMTAAEIARKYGFDLKFVKEVLGGGNQRPGHPAKDVKPVGDATLWAAVDEEGSIFYGPASKEVVVAKMKAYEGPYKLHLERR